MTGFTFELRVLSRTAHESRIQRGPERGSTLAQTTYKFRLAQLDGSKIDGVAQ